MADTDIPATNGETYDNGKHDSSNFNNPKTVKSDSQSSLQDGEENKVSEKDSKRRPSPVDLSVVPTTASVGPRSSSASQTPRTPGPSRHDTFKDKERKIGHRRVDHGGQVTYKKIGTSQIMGSIQLGIQQAVGSLASKPELDVLIQDFYVVETILFPSVGSQSTPAHPFSEFRFKVYAPIAFRHFRDLFRIAPDDYLISLCNEPLRELSNPGASGSIFYLTNDDEFIIKTVQHKEAEFLQKLLPGYYMNLNQNPRTLLPKFFGLYTYQCNAKNIRLIVMNNLLPSSIKLHQKYDLKGSTYKRKANKYERQKSSPTFKDLDFREHHPDGILLEAETYKALVKTIERDCRVLTSFKIMDYSLLVGIHNLDQAARERAERIDKSNGGEVGQVSDGGTESGGLNRSRSINRQRLVAHSTAMESIQADADPIDEEEHVPPGGIPARNIKGERLLLFLGIIDILQSYRFKKKLEHTVKSMIHDGDTISVHRPDFYAQRFQEFMAEKVFKRIPSPLRHSPSRRRGASMRAAAAIQRPISQGETDTVGTSSEVQETSMSGTLQSRSSAIVSVLEEVTSKSTTTTSGILTNVVLGSSGTAVSNNVTLTSPSTEFSKSVSQNQGEKVEGIGRSLVNPSTPGAVLNLPAVLQDRPRGRHPPPVPPRSPRGGRTAPGAAPHPRGSGRGYSYSEPQPPVGSTPPPTWETAMDMKNQRPAAPLTSSPKVQVRSSPSHVTTVAIQDDRTDVVSRKSQKLRFKGLDDTGLQQDDEPVLVGFKAVSKSSHISLEKEDKN